MIVIEDVIEDYICMIYEEHENGRHICEETFSYFDDVKFALNSDNIKINHAWIKRNIYIIKNKLEIYNPNLKNDIDALKSFQGLLMMVDDSGMKKMIHQLIRTVKCN